MSLACLAALDHLLGNLLGPTRTEAPERVNRLHDTDGQSEEPDRAPRHHEEGVGSVKTLRRMVADFRLLLDVCGNASLNVELRFRNMRTARRRRRGGQRKRWHTKGIIPQPAEAGV